MPFTKTTASELRCGAFVSCAYLYHSSNKPSCWVSYANMHSLLLYYLSEATTLIYTRLCPLMEPAFWEKEDYRKPRLQMRAREGPREHVCVIRNISEEEVKGSRKWFEAETCADLRRRHSNLQWSQRNVKKKKKKGPSHTPVPPCWLFLLQYMDIDSSSVATSSYCSEAEHRPPVPNLDVLYKTRGGIKAQDFHLKQAVKGG